MSTSGSCFSCSSHGMPGSRRQRKGASDSDTRRELSSRSSSSPSSSSSSTSSSSSSPSSSSASATATHAPRKGDVRQTDSGRWVRYNGKSWQYKCDAANCPKRSSFGFPADGFARFCGPHRPIGCVLMRKKRWCAHNGCNKQPSFAAEGEKAKFCKPHSRPGDVDVVGKRCRVEGCAKRARAVVGGKTEYCAAHRPEGSVAKVSAKRICREPGCNKYASFGIFWQKPRACAAHALPHEDNCISRRCLAPLESGGDCHKLPSYGPPGGKKKRRCAVHREAGDILLGGGKRCEHPDCTTQASFGTKATGARFCATHRDKGDTYVRSRKCKADGCEQQPSFAPPGQRPLRCRAHSVAGDVNVVSKRCVHPECQTTPSYGPPPPTDGEPRQRLRCATHAIATDVYNAGKGNAGFGRPAARFRHGLGGGKAGGGSRKRASSTVRDSTSMGSLS